MLVWFSKQTSSIGLHCLCIIVTLMLLSCGTKHKRAGHDSDLLGGSPIAQIEILDEKQEGLRYTVWFRVITAGLAKVAAPSSHAAAYELTPGKYRAIFDVYSNEGASGDKFDPFSLDISTTDGEDEAGSEEGYGLGSDRPAGTVSFPLKGNVSPDETFRVFCSENGEFGTERELSARVTGGLNLIQGGLTADVDSVSLGNNYFSSVSSVGSCELTDTDSANNDSTLGADTLAASIGGASGSHTETGSANPASGVVPVPTATPSSSLPNGGIQVPLGTATVTLAPASDGRVAISATQPVTLSGGSSNTLILGSNNTIMPEQLLATFDVQGVEVSQFPSSVTITFSRPIPADISDILEISGDSRITFSVDLMNPIFSPPPNVLAPSP